MKIVLLLLLVVFLSMAEAPRKSSYAAADRFVFVAGGDMIGPYRTMHGIDDPEYSLVVAPEMVVR